MTFGRAFYICRILVVSIALLLTLGCSLKIGEWGSVCFLDHANLELTVQHPHDDPNGP